MKSARHQAILDLIEKHPIDRQEDLLAHLREAGFDVTQATVSRDIRDLQLVKVADGSGRYRYMPAAASGKVGTWCWSSAFPAWPTPPARCLTPNSGATSSARFPAMIRFLF